MSIGKSSQETTYTWEIKKQPVDHQVSKDVQTVFWDKACHYIIQVGVHLVAIFLPQFPECRGHWVKILKPTFQT